MKITIDPLFCMFYSTVFISFSMGLYLQSVVSELVNYLWVYITIGSILLGFLIWENKKNRGRKDENN